MHSTPLDADSLRNRDLNVIDMLAVPRRLERRTDAGAERQETLILQGFSGYWEPAPKWLRG